MIDEHDNLHNRLRDADAMFEATAWKMNPQQAKEIAALAGRRRRRQRQQRMGLTAAGLLVAALGGWLALPPTDKVPTLLVERKTEPPKSVSAGELLSDLDLAVATAQGRMLSAEIALWSARQQEMERGVEALAAKRWLALKTIELCHEIEWNRPLDFGF